MQFLLKQSSSLPVPLQIDEHRIRDVYFHGPVQEATEEKRDKTEGKGGSVFLFFPFLCHPATVAAAVDPLP